MRTKALLGAAVFAAGALTTMAQVYSANIVGYVNITQPANSYSIWVNPLTNAAGNDVSVVFANGASFPGLAVYKVASGGGYDISAYDPDAGGWTQPMDVTPGTGFWLQTPDGADYVNTFVGTVMTNSVNAIPAGYSLMGSVYPMSAPLQTVLNIPLDFGDAVYFALPSGGYDTYALDPDAGGWTPSEPIPAVGQGFWVQSAVARSWTQAFAP